VAESNLLSHPFFDGEYLDNTKMRGCGEMRAVVKEENFGWLISECNPIPGLPLGRGRE